MNSKEKIFFTYPKFSKDDNYAPYYDIMLMSSIAKKRGFDTKFRNYDFKVSSVYDFLRDLRVFKPDFLVINTTENNLEKELSILTQAGDLLDDIVVVVKGNVFNNNACSIMQKYPEIDIALKENFENSFDEIIRYKNLKDIKNIAYQIKNKIVYTHKEKEILTFPCYFDSKLEEVPSFVTENTKKEFLPVNFSNMAFDTSFVIDEIVKGVTNKKIKNFYIYCDNFLKDISVACKFLNALRKERLRIKFMVDINLSSVDANSKQVLSLAKKSGCELVNLYVDYVMELDDVKKVQKIFKQAGLKVNLKHNRIYKNNLTDRLAFNTNFNSILK